MTYREANEEIREALNKGEYRQVRQAKVQEEKEEPVQSKLAPLDERHRTYTELLDRLPLYSVHRENLRSRGLTIEQIKERRYRSVPMYGLHKIAETLQESGCVLEGVPGFYRDTEERWTLNFKTKNSGFLVPVESMDGKIQACQIRLDHPRDNNKYLWFFQCWLSTRCFLRKPGSCDRRSGCGKRLSDRGRAERLDCPLPVRSYVYLSGRREYVPEPAPGVGGISAKKDEISL